MRRKINKELQEFLEFKKEYQFNQRKLIIENGEVYCEGQLVQNEEGIKIGETENWINVGFNIKESFSKMLSNLYPYEFKFRGKKLNSIESFFQGIKFKDKEVQNYVFSYFGINAVYIKEASDYDWKESGIIYWQGKPINRFDKEYENLVDELYISAIQNPLYRSVLLKCNKPIIHAIGKEDKKDTTFTRYEFEFELNCLKDFLRRTN